MYKLRKLGLFAFISLPAPAKHKVPAARRPAPSTAKLFYSKGELNLIEVKRQNEQTNEDPIPVDGLPLPDASEGWMQTRSSDPELHCVGVRCIRLTDGSHLKYFKMLVKPSVMKRKKAKLRRKLRELDQGIARAAKQEARLTLWMMGKQV
ncbi:MAG TPA: hypothetical protein VMP68_14540 [Candidatus Eisenbacteria bacterium]|nr:hypothetical protein [Candidatus Eisenbacteria bacterium]